MNNAVVMLGSTNECVMFQVTIGGHRYACPVSREALYDLCKTQDPQQDRIDAYLDLKSKIHKAVRRLVRDDATIPPEILEARHFLQESQHLPH